MTAVEALAFQFSSAGVPDAHRLAERAAGRVRVDEIRTWRDAGETGEQIAARIQTRIDGRAAGPARPERDAHMRRVAAMRADFERARPLIEAMKSERTGEFAEVAGELQRYGNLPSWLVDLQSYGVLKRRMTAADDAMAGSVAVAIGPSVDGPKRAGQLRTTGLLGPARGGA